MNFLNKKEEKEPWQIAAARFCVDNAEKGFTQESLNAYIKSHYLVNERHLEQFHQEEIHKPAGREHSRDFLKTGEGGLWIPPLDLVSKITDYDELKEARKNAKQAFQLSIIAIIISAITLFVSFSSPI